MDTDKSKSPKRRPFNSIQDQNQLQKQINGIIWLLDNCMASKINIYHEKEGIGLPDLPERIVTNVDIEFVASNGISKISLRLRNDGSGLTTDVIDLILDAVNRNEIFTFQRNKPDYDEH